MSTITTLKSLHTDSLLTINLDISLMKQNFKVLDDFLKQFSQFQKKFNDLQKSQKIMYQDYSAFKQNTESQFLTINGMLEAKNEISQGKSSAVTEQIAQMKNSIKQLKFFLTQSTRQEHQAQEIKEKEQNQLTKQISNRINQLDEKHKGFIAQIQQLKSKTKNLIQNSAKKVHISDLVNGLSSQLEKIQFLKKDLGNVQTLLKETRVEQFKASLQEIDRKTQTQIREMKIRLNTKSDVSDVIKLEEMLLNIVEISYRHCHQNLANKTQTKRALIFLEKRINALLVTLLGEEQGQREAFLAVKQYKCMSCSKDLGELEGKLDRYKAWSVFPAKQPSVKDKYPGFGSGFQSIIESTVAKKGGQITVDEKGRMISPFNMTGTFQGSFLKTSRSQHKLAGEKQNKSKILCSPSKSSLKYQTNMMIGFGKNQYQMNIVNEYYNTEKGIQNFMFSSGKRYKMNKNSEQQSNQE